MMEHKRVVVNEGVLQIPADWVDLSVNIFSHEEVRVTIHREPAQTRALEEIVAAHHRDTDRQRSGFAVDSTEPTVVAGRRGVLSSGAYWDNGKRTVFQELTFLVGDTVVFVVARGETAVASAVSRAIRVVMESIQFPESGR